MVDALQKLLTPSKIIYDDPSWPSPLYQYFAVHHALQHPYLGGSASHMRLGCKQWLDKNYALISHIRPNNVNNEREWKWYCNAYLGQSRQGDEYTPLALANILRRNIIVYTGAYTHTQSPNGITAQQSTSSTLFVRSLPMKLSPGAALNTSFATGPRGYRDRMRPNHEDLMLEVEASL